LEFWCGSGRFASLLNQNFPEQFDYVWIDLSDKLLSFARKDNPNLAFIQWDITKLITDFWQESFDLIVWTSSFQHIPTNKERSYLMKNFYRLLDYDGMLLMTNRSLSKRFTKKNWKIILEAKILSWLKFDKWSARDLMVPRTDNKWKTYERFYHFFSLEELERLAIFSGLTTRTNTYIDEHGEFTDNEKLSRSSLFVAQKSPIINQ
jgi:ubiquinone/menaquinone biosynthesis C-methylase UbiE